MFLTMPLWAAGGVKASAAFGLNQTKNGYSSLKWPFGVLKATYFFFDAFLFPGLRCDFAKGAILVSSAS